PSGLRARLIPHNGGGARVAIAACASAGVTPDDAGVWIAIGSPAKADPRTRSLQIIVDNMSHGAAIANGEGRFVYVNRAWAAMHGVSPEKMAGMPMRDFHDDDAYQADVVPLSLAAAEHPVAFAELTHRRADGGSFRTTVRALPVAVEGHANAFLILTRGADELRSMNAGETAVDADLAADLDRAREEIEDLRSQLLQAQRLEVINNLAAGLAHNFNNLLTAIVGNQELAYPYVSEEGRVFLANARQATRRAADLSRKLLSFSKKGKIERMSMDPVPVIMETTKMLRGAIDPRIVVQCVAPLDIWQVFADPGDIHQIAMNLCVNARDAIQDVLDREGPRDGPFQIVVKLENVEIDGNYTRVDPQATPGSYVTLSISDNGCGMDDETRRRVFEPFFTTKHARSGTGLGLATVFDMVKRMHGWISLDSEAGRGTTFRVYLPRHSGDLTLAADSEHFQELRGGHETILLVDDELVLRKLGEATLTRMGYRVVLAPDGMEGVKLFERMREDIDLVILDLTMPIMSGQEALELIKGLAPEKPVILSSGYADREAHDAQPDLGWSAFLPKPFDPNDLVRVVRQVLDNPLPH
ncbi:response regulator, partial [bacterium]|nr:response regulator [bacterium]